MINGIQVVNPYTGVITAPQVIGSEPVQLTQGEVLRVSVSFNYRVAEETTIHVRGCLGHPNVFGQGEVTGVTELTLNPVTVLTPISANVDIRTSDGIIWGIGETKPGTYDLFVRIDEEPDVNDTILQCVTVVEKAGFLDTIMAIVPLFLLMMIMGMMMPMMKTGEEVEGGEIGESESEGGKMTELATQTEKTGTDKMMGGMMAIMIMMMGLQLIGAMPSVACTEGATKCVGYDLYRCDGAGNWVLIQQNATECGYVPVAAYGCPYCSESFATLQELIMHVSLVHPEMPPIQEVDITWD